MISERPEALRIKIRTESGKSYELELLRAAPVAADADLGIIDATGRHRNGADDGLHYQGIVAGQGRSIATLSAFPNGDVMVLFGSGDGNYNLGRLDDGSGRYVLYNDRDLKIRPHPECKTDDNGKVNEDRASGGMKTTRPMLCNRVRVYWEVANNVFVSKASNLITTRNYTTALFNQVAAMYRNERIELELTSMYIWTVADEYPQATSSTALNKFVQYWNFLGNSFNADLAHLLTRDNAGNGGGNGGLAYLDVLCNRAYSYAYSDIYGTFQAIPTFSWDVQVITHETGHNLGSKHTHWCGWNTGAGGGCGAIDNCATVESVAGCSTCSSTFLASNTSWKGTVMSYCHLVNGKGIDLANGFGTLPGNAIRAQVSAAACLDPLLRANLVTTPICNGSGTVRVALDPLNGGTAPYTYSWSGGAGSTQAINPVSAGTYGVTLQDSNRCQLPLSTYLGAKSVPGDAGLVHANFRLPACCQTTDNKLELRTNLTANMTSCQTVYWIRSDAPITSFAQARSHFDTASVTIAPSKSVSAAGAFYDVAAPASCQSPIAWYYTPVAVNKPRPADSFLATATVTAGLFNLGAQMGTSVSLPDQTSLPVLCDPSDTPTVAQILVTVSSYSGRAGKLSIMIRNAAGNVIYQRTGLPGNGTYLVTKDSIKTSMLEAMTVLAFDYNCATATTCTPSSVIVSASRKVRYSARPASMSAGCQQGTSIEVSFAPGACTKLSVENLSRVKSWNASLSPNPASSGVTLSFQDGSSAMSLDITDILGKRIGTYQFPAGAGMHSQQIDVQSWAKGVYFFNLRDASGNSQRMKLVVE